MELAFNRKLGDIYKSNSQKIRIMSESWVAKNIYCPCCGNYKLTPFANNKPVADFYCDKCKETFELKSKNGKLGRKINDGAYYTAIKRITSNKNPHLFVLEYDDYNVVNLELIPKYFFTPNIIEKRKPLSQRARRAGWIGCNIVFGDIPSQGRISIIRDKKILNSEFVVSEYNNTKDLQVNDISRRGWIFDILKCVNHLNKEVFTLDDMYKFEDKLKEKYINNNNIRPKIRQQLQYLRDKGYVEFLGNGNYKKIK